jgi:hypothetical protein
MRKVCACNLGKKKGDDVDSFIPVRSWLTIVGYSSKICKCQRRFAPTLATFIPERVATFPPECMATFTGIRMFQEFFDCETNIFGDLP